MPEKRKAGGPMNRLEPGPSRGRGELLDRPLVTGPTQGSVDPTRQGRQEHRREPPAPPRQRELEDVRH
ncbi:hypothetical protein GFS60_07784 (plasmid) [Rhodococcus sp. WAY2]|nr:hypothetical protein GFS60_07784 [Rhodococcus sp. WAY2]